MNSTKAFNKRTEDQTNSSLAVKPRPRKTLEKRARLKKQKQITNITGCDHHTAPAQLLFSLTSNTVGWNNLTPDDRCKNSS